MDGDSEILIRLIVCVNLLVKSYELNYFQIFQIKTKYVQRLNWGKISITESVVFTVVLLRFLIL